MWIQAEPDFLQSGFTLQPTDDFLHHVIWQPKLPALNEK